MIKHNPKPAAAIAFALTLVFGVLLAKYAEATFDGLKVVVGQDAKTTGDNSPAVTGSNNKVAVDSKPAEPEVPLSEADADKFLLAVEKANHANDNIQAAYHLWLQQPGVQQLQARKQEENAALQKLAGEILKKMGLDDGKHQIDADGASKTPRPKAVLRPEVKK
jgi:hypothetical protein